MTTEILSKLEKERREEWNPTLKFKHPYCMLVGAIRKINYGFQIYALKYSQLFQVTWYMLLVISYTVCLQNFWEDCKKYDSIEIYIEINYCILLITVQSEVDRRLLNDISDALL